MEPREAYDQWAGNYDAMQNRTRDLEGVALRKVLDRIDFHSCLEIGCGTGKNTSWLLERAQKITSVDLSEEMLARAKEKIQSDKVRFIQVDINKEWDFIKDEKFDLVTFSLVLEHIEDLAAIFGKVAEAVGANGYVYIGELHPFKQYGGTKARFETEQGLQVVTCYNHHISDFTNAARDSGFSILQLDEYFDENDRSGIPRVLTLLLQSGR